MFSHLHVHSEKSLLDGAARIKDLIDTAKAMGMNSLAITDHGNMFGVIDFWQYAKAQGINPVLGCEVYTAARSMEDKDAEKDKWRGHLVLLAENNTGYKNLMKIVSAAYKRGFYYKPRVDNELLRKHSEGIIALSACVQGSIPQALLVGDYEAAKRRASEYLDIFGRDNFFIELQDHGLEDQRRAIPGLINIATELKIGLVVSNDVHYIKKTDAKAQAVLMCVQKQKVYVDDGKYAFGNDEFYLKSEEEMRQLFPDLPEAYENTQKIADRCRVDLDFSQRHLPDFTSPKGYTNDEYLRHLCEEGLKARYGSEAASHTDRLNYEIKTIEDMGFIEYFLIVWDFIRFAKENGIAVGPGRGSAAGSIVAYTLNITDIDPIKYNLIFERFLNPERVSMPDIDIDFCVDRRAEVIEYVNNKYGEDRVCQIITFGTMKARLAIKDVARALDIPLGEVDKIVKLFPNDLNFKISDALESSEDLRTLVASNPRYEELFDIAQQLEGVSRNAGTHAAGVVICKSEIDDVVPIYYSQKKGLSTQFTMTRVEELGMLKMDFLGLRNLTVIEDAKRQILKNYNKNLDFSTMEYNDKAVYELISRADTDGVFQLESAGMKDFLGDLKPDCFEDMVAGISLYRPGPMDNIPQYIKNKKNPERITYIHEALRPILSVTYGVIVYQEQVMQIVRDLGGFSFGRSDEVRRAMGKKKLDIMESARLDFISGCEGKGISEDIAIQIYDQLIEFANYGFNKSHAAAYAVIAYQTAYLKAYYRPEFMAALMTSFTNDTTQIAKYIKNAESYGIEVLPPCVLTGEKRFSVRDGKIVFGMQGIKNVGDPIIDSFISLRKEMEEKGKILQTLDELISKLPPEHINKRSIESLIFAGAMDNIQGNRAQKLAAFPVLAEREKKARQNAGTDQLSLFDLNTDLMQETTITLPDVKEFNNKELLEYEKSVLGIYISGHPLNEYKHIIEKVSDVTTADLLPDEPQDEEDELALEVQKKNTKIKNNMPVSMIGIINSVKKIMTKKGDDMAFITLEDLYGEVEVIVFPKVYKTCAGLLEKDRTVVLRGNLDITDNGTKIFANKLTEIERAVKYYEDLARKAS
jgi:DNA polymerase-3 subunit alpha